MVNGVEDGGHPQGSCLLLDPRNQRAPLGGRPPALAALDACYWGVECGGCDGGCWIGPTEQHGIAKRDKKTRTAVEDGVGNEPRRELLEGGAQLGPVEDGVLSCGGDASGRPMGGVGRKRPQNKIKSNPTHRLRVDEDGADRHVIHLRHLLLERHAPQPPFHRGGVRGRQGRGDARHEGGGRTKEGE